MGETMIPQTTYRKSRKAGCSLATRLHILSFYGMNNRCNNVQWVYFSASPLHIVASLGHSIEYYDARNNKYKIFCHSLLRNPPIRWIAQFNLWWPSIFLDSKVLSLDCVREYKRERLKRWNNTGLFISTSGISELDCATTKRDTAERSISIGRESLKVFFCTRGLSVLPGSTARG